MTTTRMTVTAESVRDELLERYAGEGVARGSMFGSLAIKLDGKVLATFRDDRAVVKVGRDSPLLVESLANGGHLFDPSGKNRPMKDWLVIEGATPDELAPYLLEAIALHRA